MGEGVGTAFGSAGSCGWAHAGVQLRVNECSPLPPPCPLCNSKDRVKEQESKARLAELVEAHKGRTSSRR